MIAYFLSACNTAPQQPPSQEKELPKHVILIGFDGLSSHCLNNAMSFRKHAPMSAENPSGCTPVAVQYIKEKRPNLCAVIYDIAGTMAYLLDVQQLQVWIARPIVSAFE